MPVYKLGKDRIVAISCDGFAANFLRPEDGKDGILVIVHKNLKDTDCIVISLPFKMRFGFLPCFVDGFQDQFKRITVKLRHWQWEICACTYRYLRSLRAQSHRARLNHLVYVGAIRKQNNSFLCIEDIGDRSRFESRPKSRYIFRGK